MKKALPIVLLVSALTFFSGCKEEPLANPELRMGFMLTAGTDVLEYNTSYTVNGSTIQFTLVKFYVSQVALLNDSGQYVRFSDKYLLIDAEGENYFEMGEIPSGTYTALQFGLGVDSSRNDITGSLAIPAFDYPDTHPLNPSAQMYWSWNPGYIWMKLEGKIDLNNNSSFADPGETFSIHTGLNPAYRVINLPLGVSGDVSVSIAADILRFFDGYDLTGVKRNAHPMTTGSAEFGYVEEIVNNSDDVFQAFIMIE